MTSFLVRVKSQSEWGARREVNCLSSTYRVTWWDLYFVFHRFPSLYYSTNPRKLIKCCIVWSVAQWQFLRGSYLIVTRCCTCGIDKLLLFVRGQSQSAPVCIEPWTQASCLATQAQETLTLITTDSVTAPHAHAYTWWVMSWWLNLC